MQNDNLTEESPSANSPTEMRRILPADMVERGRCPFDPPSGLQRRRGQGTVQPLDLLNGARAWLVTGFEQARTVLADPRFSADKVRHREATQLQPEEVDAQAQPVAIESREDGFFVFMDPPDDLLSGLVHDAEPPLTDAQLTDVALVLLGAGHETTANMLGLGTFALLENPDQLAALREDPSLIDNTVEELLRFLTIIQLGVSRVTTEPVTLDGVDIPADATVVVATPEVNRDPEHWPDPDKLDVHRPRAPHLAFGHGVHQCLGQQLARIEMRIGLGELISRLPDLRLAVPAEQVPLRNEMLIFGVHSLPVAWS